VVRVAPETGTATPAAAREGRKAWRRLAFGVAVGLVLIGVSAFLVAGPMKSGQHSTANAANDTSLPSRTVKGAPIVVSLGVVDVRGGVVSLNPTVSGRVTAVLVQDNAEVRAGQVLVQLDDRIAKTQLAEAEAGLQAAKAQLTEAVKGPKQHELLLTQQKAALAAARHDLAAARLAAAQKKRLADVNQLSREEADAAAELVKKLESAESAEIARNKALELRDPEQDVARSEADVKAKTALRDRARDALDEYRITAPANGTVLRVMANAGELLGPQSREAAILFCPAGPRVVRAEVEQEYASRVAIGQTAAIEDASHSGGPTWTGRVVRIADWFTLRRTVTPDQVPVQEVRTLECLVELDASSQPLRIGQRVRVRLYAE
jgi:multidrug resistance efflux pump